MPTFELITGRDPMVSVSLGLNEKIYAESNAMVMHDGGVSLEGVVRGGLLSSLVRSVTSNESFFLQEITGTNARAAGNVILAPPLPGDIEIVDVGPCQYTINQSCFLACDSGVTIVNKLNSLSSGLFGDTGGFVVMQTEGRGKLALSGFGQIMIVDVEPGQEITVDNGHLVAWDSSLTHQIGTASSKKGFIGRVVSTAMSGEFVVLKFTGKGKILIGSRNQQSFDTYVRSLQR